jgi:hypothetical protein
MQRRPILHEAQHHPLHHDEPARLVMPARIEPQRLGLRTLRDRDARANRIGSILQNRSVVVRDFDWAEETDPAFANGSFPLPPILVRAEFAPC